MLLGLTLLIATPASASHYLISDVPDVVPAAHHPSLKAAGITDTAQLYERTVTVKARRALASSTGIAVGLLADWARFLDLMQLRGVGPKMVRLMNAAGVNTLKKLSNTDGAGLQARMRAVNKGGRFSEVVPPPEVVSAWIAAAKRIKPRLE